MYFHPTILSHLKTRVLHINMSFLTFRRQKTQIISSTPSPAISPVFQIPEILERILSYLDMYSPAFYVCRLWYNTSLPLIPIRILWSDYRKFVQKDRRVSIEIDLSKNSPLYHHQRPGWKDFLTALNRDQNNIFELIVNGSHLTELMNPLIQRIDTLTNLTIISESLTSIQLCYILEFCPNLLRLNIEMPTAELWVRHDITALPGQASQFDVENHKIESIVIKGAALSMQRMRTILECCTELQNLMLVEILDVSSETGVVDRACLYRTASYSCPQLKRLMISERKKSMSLDTMNTLISLFYPRLGYPTRHRLESICVMDIDIYFCGADLISPIVDTGYFMNITTLEIFSSTTYSGRITKLDFALLHRLLCSAPCLLHLIAPNVKYWSDILDGDTSLKIGNSSLHNLSGPWVCRKLQTLRLAFSPQDTHPREPFASSRILFDYISRACPDLRVLEIRNWTMSITPMSGVCWLARLKSLNKLTLSFDIDLKLKPKYISWMGWPSAIVPASPYDQDDFNNLGSLKDLLAFQMHPSWQKNTEYCMPDLTYFQINLFHKDAKSSNSKENVAKMINSVRPNLRVRCNIGPEVKIFL